MNDHHARERALDPRQSFIVQAPAGSGKTELLIQRYLKLLSVVEQPEEILAITFTQKAAAEMKTRVLSALLLANTQNEPSTPHTQKTWALAKAALTNDKKYEWHLLKNPNRMRIQTIDGLSAWLASNFTNVSGIPAQAEISEEPQEFYLAAAHAIVNDLENNQPWSEAISTLLLHLDNQVLKLEALIAELLAYRDQWLGYVIRHTQKADLKVALEKTLLSLTNDTLKAIADSFPKEQTKELLSLYCYAHPQTDWHTLPPTKATHKEDWLQITTLLLTSEGDWRKQVTIRQGFPSASSAKTEAEKQLFNEMKERYRQCIATLSQHENLKLALQSLRNAPPLHYPESQWHVLNALLTILPLAAAQLSLLFQKQNKIDFIEQSQAALRALYEVKKDNLLPTELTLALDYRIEHILVDEFQDTALNQIELLRYLTSGWERGDHRTLFLVGDPMQSIYRFRKAEVGLFLEAQEKGIEHISLEPLFLSHNFRSESGVVEWINQTFSTIFPKQDHSETGAVSFKPSVATKENTTQQSVQIHTLVEATAKDEAMNIISIIKAQTPETSVAILVKSRSHLVEIIDALHSHHIPFNAVEIAALAKQPIIQDLLSLTRALFDLNDRIAWLAILRAPWCGLSLNDLTRLTTKDLSLSVWEHCKHPELINSLSTRGQHAIKRILPILEEAISHRFRTALCPWIKQTWLQLGGPACALNEAALEHAHSFFDLLSRIKNNQIDKSLAGIKAKLTRLFSNISTNKESNLHIMTMHKSKGLEFDVVILPALDRPMPNDKPKLIQWMEIAHVDETRSVLFAPIKSSLMESDAIYDALSQQEKIKQLHENARVLYVACTRARKELHLFGKIQVDEKNDIKKPLASSFLSLLWHPLKLEHSEGMHKSVHPEEMRSIVSKDIPNPTGHPLRRLSANWILPLKEAPSTETQNTQTTYEWHSETPRHTGIIIHQILEQLGNQGIDWWLNADPALQKQYIARSCQALKTPMDDIPAVIERVSQIINKTLTDHRGRWILTPHPEARCEWSITTSINNKTIDLIIDRSFIADGIFWIIDYKTFELEAPHSEAIKKEHALQLEQYARAVSHLTTLPIHLGIYCPQNGTWVEWAS